MDFLIVVPTCSDGDKNQDETDIDCGGGSCPRCPDSKTCNIPSDCVSGVCSSGVCQGMMYLYTRTVE